jgi:2-C-methyl-D-erythritol 4-phosphate cytidylyltransferase
MRCSLIIPAAGRGTRFGGELPKQLLPLCGRPVLARSLDAFAGLVDEAVLAVSDELRDAVTALVSAAPPPFPVRLVAGGALRQDSVHAALIATDPRSDAVLVHDAVRPLVPRQCIEDCRAALRQHVAAVVAVPCAATVKRTRLADGWNLVDQTVPRDDLWLAQTPQGFLRGPGLAAFARAAAERWICSDDVQVLERAGQRVAVVPGDARNFKITTPDDWAIAEALVIRQQAQAGKD